MRGPDTPLKPAAGTYRIALLGDSFIEAFEVPYQQTVGEVVERRLSAARGTPVEVLNFGVGGYGTTQELLTLRHEVWKYSPDLILLAVTTGNDISDNYRPLSQGSYRPFYEYQGSRLVLDTTFLGSSEYRSRTLWTRRLLGLVNHSRLVQLVNRVRHTRRKGDRQANVRRPGRRAGTAGRSADATQHAGVAGGLAGHRGSAPSDAGRVSRQEHAVGCRHADGGIQVTPLPTRKSDSSQLGAKDLVLSRAATGGVRGARGNSGVEPGAPRWPGRPRSEGLFPCLSRTASASGTGAPGHEAAGELIAAWLARTDLRSQAGALNKLSSQ